MRSSEAVVTHDVSVRQLILDITAKSKEYQDAENKEGLIDWSLVFSCVVFTISKERFNEIS